MMITSLMKNLWQRGIVYIKLFVAFLAILHIIQRISNNTYNPRL